MNAVVARLALFPPRLIRRVVAGERFWSFCDQAIVSAMSFLSLYLVARWTEVSEVGLYSAGLSLIAMYLVLQDSLVMRPYSVRMFSHAGTLEQHSFSALLAVIALALVTSVAIVLWYWLEGGGTTAGIALAIAAAIPASALREFVRRHAFANLKVHRAFLVDCAGVSIGIASLLFLGAWGMMSAVSALLAIVWSFALPSAVCLLTSRAEHEFSARSLRETATQGWRIGKWFLPHRLATEGQGYVIHWATLLLAGPALTGLYSASLAIVSLGNPLLFGLLNLMTPRAVRAFHRGGHAGLKAQAAGEALILAGVLAVLVTVVCFFGEAFMRLLFSAPEYSGHGQLLLLLSLASSAGWLGAPAAVALQSSGRERAAALISIGAFAHCIAAVWIALPAWGLTGAAAALLAVQSAATAIRWAVLLRLGESCSDPSGRK